MWGNITFLILFPLVGALLGWFTNFLAVKMLFHPKQPKTVLRFKIWKWQVKGITFQGIFPKRQKMIATKIGKVVADELLSVEDIKEKVVTQASMDNIYDQVEIKMDNFLEGRMTEKFPLVSMFASKKLKMGIRDQMLEVKVSP